MVSKTAKSESTSKMVPVPAVTEHEREADIATEAADVASPDVPTDNPVPAKKVPAKKAATKPVPEEERAKKAVKAGPANDAELTESESAIASGPVILPSVPASKTRTPFVRLLKYGFLIVLLGCIAVAAYLGWPEFRERYIQPVETTASDLSAVTERLTIAEGRVDELATSGAARDGRLQAMEENTEQLAGDIDALQGQIDRHGTRIEGLEDQSQLLSDQLADGELASARQIELAIATEYLSRARLFLYQANYGLAEQDVSAAVATLSALESDPGLTAVIQRLNGVEQQLPERPVAAADDLDIAWYDLLGPGPGLRSRVEE